MAPPDGNSFRTSVVAAAGHHQTTQVSKSMADPEISTQNTSIEIEGFRAFRDRAHIELRPLTLIFGRNQAGKSTLLRLLPALADAIYGTVPVFDMNAPALMGATFKELGWLGPEPFGSPSIRLEAIKPPTHLEIQLTDDRGIVPNKIRTGSGASDYCDVSLAGNATRSANLFLAPYAGNMGHDEHWEGEISFSSFIPAGLPPVPSRHVETVRAAFSRLERVQWLAAPRPGQNDFLRPSKCCRPDGHDLPNLLAERRDILALASEWLSDPKILGESIVIGKDSSGSNRFELRRTSNESLPNHLSGEGARWMLPILLCACWAELAQDGPTMLAIEELEARLHPNLQISLLERLLQTVKRGIPCVLETHSIYVLRRAQLAIVKKELKAQDVAIYWIEREGHAAQVRPISVNDDGTLVGWNPETFEEEQQLARELFEARWQSGG